MVQGSSRQIAQNLPTQAVDGLVPDGPAARRSSCSDCGADVLTCSMASATDGAAEVVELDAHFRIGFCSESGGGLMLLE